MVSKCANPACSARFHYLHEGKIFKLETGAAESDASAASPQQVEFFWLCAECCKTLEVVLRNGVAATQPLPAYAPQQGGRETTTGLPARAHKQAAS